MLRDKENAAFPTMFFLKLFWRNPNISATFDNLCLHCHALNLDQTKILSIGELK